MTKMSTTYAPDISIITVCLNSEMTIMRNIQSVNEQKFQSIEQIFVDGGSVDTTLKIIKKLSKVNNYLISESDTGIYNAMNKGLKLARGKHILFLNSDDFFENTYVLQNFYNVINDSDPDVIISQIRYVDRFNPCKVVRVWKVEKFSLSKLKYGWMPPHPGTVIRRSRLIDVGGFDECYKISGDYDLLLRILKLENISVQNLNIYSVKMCKGGVSNNSIKNITQKMREDYRIISTNRIGNIMTLFCKNIRKIPQFLRFSLR